MDQDRLNWRDQRRTGIMVIAVSSVVALAIWIAIYLWGPVFSDHGDLTARMVFAVKLLILAILFTLVMGVEAVAHERLQSPAFDPLQGQETQRLRVNQRYLQNTLEQSVIFATALMGLALYADSPAAMRAMLATAVIWVLARLAFWIGYHRDAAWRGLGMSGMFASMVALIYVAVRIGHDLAGMAGVIAVITAVTVFEAVLFLKTRP